ncbi:MAG: hypothetical protein ACHQVS_04735 [Candidatus Babeliales bacterium]
MIIKMLFFVLATASSLHAADNRDTAKLEDIRTHFDKHIVKASNHHERAVIFNNAVKDIEPLKIDENLKNETFKHCVTTITTIEERILDTIVDSTPKIAESVKRVEHVEAEKHKLLAQVDDLQNAPHRARISAKIYIAEIFDNRKTALAGGVGAGVIVAPEEVKHHAHEQVVSVHKQHDKLDTLVTEFYTDIYNKKLNSQQMQHKLDALINKITDLSGVEATDKEKAIHNATQAAQARLQEHGERLPARGAEKKPTRRLKGRVVHTEEEERGRRYAPSRKPAPKGETKKESVTQEAARLRRERAAKREAE